MAYPLAERNMQDGSRAADEMAAVASGALNIPLDAVRYPGLIVNYIMSKTGIRSEDKAEYASQAINDFFDEPPFFPESLNDARSGLRRDHPNYTLLGEMLGATGIAKGLLGRAINVSAKNGAPTVYRNRLTNGQAYSPGAYYSGAAAGALGNELITEDFVQWLNNQVDDATQSTGGSDQQVGSEQ